MKWIKTEDKETGTTIFENGKFSMGKKKIVILSGIHGDEVEIAQIANSLIERLSLRELTNKFNILFIPFVNIKGIKERTRNDPGLKLDLNRCFNLTKNPSVIKLVKKITSNSSLVIDIHCFPDTNQALTALFFSSKQNNHVSLLNKKLVNTFKPDFIWHLDFEDTDIEKVGSLGEFLTNKGIPNFAIETTTPEFTKPKDSKRFINNLIQTIQAFENDFTGLLFKNKHLEISRRIVTLSKTSGIFIPKVKLFSHVNKNDRIGTIIDMDLNEKIVTSDSTGEVMFIRKSMFVSTNEKLCGIASNE